MSVLSGGTANSTQSCEWATGCVGLEAEEWLAASFEFKLSNSSPSGTATITCTVDGTFLKKSELPSHSLPSSEKRSVPIHTVITLTHPPKPAEDNYWVVSCAKGSICAAVPADAETVDGTVEDGARVLKSLDAPLLPDYLMIGDSISLGYYQGD